jgi:cis-3-alkyl-4-acyloxetan-2-one decarboxylase
VAGDAIKMKSALDTFLEDHPRRDFDRDGLRMHYIDEGSGDPVVMLHGNPTWSFMYRHLVAALRDSNRVIVPDHIGCGLSDKPDDSRYTYTLANRVDDLERLLHHLGLERDLTLVLHDWGGMIGMVYAARHPERISRLIVTNTAAFHKPAAKRLPRALAICRTGALGALLVQGFNAFCIGTALIGCKKLPMPRAVRAAYVAPYDSWGHRIAILRFVQDIPLRPAHPSYETVSWVQDHLHRLESIPIMIHWGMKDFVFDHHFLDEWIRRFPEADVHRYPDAGHYLFEDESDSINDRVRSFLAARPAIPEHAG